MFVGIHTCTDWLHDYFNNKNNVLNKHIILTNHIQITMNRLALPIYGVILVKVGL